MEAKEENIELETTIADQIEDASESVPPVDLTKEDSAKEENSDNERNPDDEDIEQKGCCRHVNIIKAKYNNTKEKFWFKKISQIFTLFSTLWMFGTK